MSVKNSSKKASQSVLSILFKVLYFMLLCEEAQGQI